MLKKHTKFKNNVTSRRTLLNVAYPDSISAFTNEYSTIYFFSQFPQFIYGYITGLEGALPPPFNPKTLFSETSCNRTCYRFFSFISTTYKNALFRHAM